MKSKYNRLTRLNQIVLAVATTGALMSSAYATTYTWTYYTPAANKNWSDITVWDVNGVPVNDGTADVVFNDSNANGYLQKVDPQNSLPTPSNDWSINSLKFVNFGNGGSARVITGVDANATLSVGAGGITQNEVGSPCIGVPLICTASQTWNINYWNGNNTGGLYFGGDGWGGTLASGGDITLNNGVTVTKSGVGDGLGGTTGNNSYNVEFFRGTTTTIGTGAFKEDGGYFIFHGAGQFGRLGTNAVSVTENSKTRGGFSFVDYNGGTFANNIVFTNGTFTTNALNLYYGNGNVAGGITMYLTGGMSGVVNGGGTNASGFINTSPAGTGYTYDDRNKIFFQGDSSGLTCTTADPNVRGALQSAAGITVLDHNNAIGTNNSLPIIFGTNSTDTLNSYCGLLATSGHNVTANILARWVQNGNTYRSPATEFGLSGTGSVTFSGKLWLNSTSANGYAGTGFGDHQIPRVKLTAPSGGTVIFSGVIADTDSAQPNLAPVTILGGGTVEYSNTANTYAGHTNIREGTLLLHSDNGSGNYNSTNGGGDISLGDTVSAPSGGDVVAATTADLSGVSGFTYDNITDFGTITFSSAVTSLDGVSLNNGDRIFYKDASYSPERTGVYTRTDSTHWTRAADLNTPASFSTGLRIHVTYGTLNGGKNYYLPTGLYTTAVLNNNSSADAPPNAPRARFLFNPDAQSNANVALLQTGSQTLTLSNIYVTNNLSTGTSTLGGATADDTYFEGVVSLAKDVILTAAPGGYVEFDAGITGSNNVTISGGGIVSYWPLYYGQIIYTGTTTVVAGSTLELDGDGTLDYALTNTNVTVNGNLIGHQGVVSGTLNVTSTGTLAPGASVYGINSYNLFNGTSWTTPDISTIKAGATTLAGHLAVKVSGASNDELISTGAIDISGAHVDVSVLGGGFTQPYYVIATGTSITGTPAGVTAGYQVTNTGTQLRLSLAPTTHSISGTVTLNGTGLNGVNVSDGTRSATTSGGGAYTITSVPDSATYTVTPTMTGYTFTPASLSVTLSGSDVTGKDFAVADTLSNWATSNGLSGADALPTANPAHDGLNNLVKYALGLNPAVSAVPPGTHTGNTLTFTKGTMAKADTNIQYSIEESTDLSTWTAPTGTPPSGTVVDGANDITYTYASGQAKRFARLKVVQIP